jgi:hypothetical protein
MFRALAIIITFAHFQHRPASGLQGRIPLMQRLNTHKHLLRALSLQITIHRTHALVHKQSHRLTVTMTHKGTDVSERQG